MRSRFPSCSSRAVPFDNRPRELSWMLGQLGALTLFDRVPYNVLGVSIGDRLMVGQQPLKLRIGVRIPVPEPSGPTN